MRMPFPVMFIPLLLMPLFMLRTPNTHLETWRMTAELEIEAMHSMPTVIEVPETLMCPVPPAIEQCKEEPEVITFDHSMGGDNLFSWNDGEFAHNN